MENHPSTGDQTLLKPKFQFPLVQSVNHHFAHRNEEWTIYFYSEFSNIFLDSSGQLDESAGEILNRLVGGDFKDYRVQLDVKSLPFLTGVLFSSKQIHFCTPRLGRELFLLHECKDTELTRDDENFKLFRLHTERVASLTTADSPSVIERVSYRYNLPKLSSETGVPKVETEMEPILERLKKNLNTYRPTLFERVSDFGLGLTAQFALLRIHLLKFIAILPSLDHDKSGREVKRILLEAFKRLLKDHQKALFLGKKGQSRPLPTWLVVVIYITQVVSKLIPPGPLAWLVRTAVKFMAKRFIAGETIETATQNFKILFQTGRDVTLDQLGELVVSEKEADNYCQEVLNLINGFGIHVKKGAKNQAGILRAHVSIKVSALCADFKPEAPEYTYNLVAPRLKRILIAAKEKEVFINIDAEHYHYRDLVFNMYQRVLLETEELKDFPHTGIVLQAYLRDASKHLEEIIELAKKRGLTMPIRLVKGAYWDAETVEAKAHSFDAPEFLNKEETDIHFRQMVYKIFQAYPHIQLCLASHNFSDHAFSVALREKFFKEIPVVEHQCLHMTYEALSTAMAKMNWVVRNYVPIGSLLVGMAYLVRRIMENSSQVGVLTIMRSHKKKAKLLPPEEVHSERRKNAELDWDETMSSMTDEFFNVAPARIYLEEHRDHVMGELKSFSENGLNKTYANSFALEGEWSDIASSSDSNLLVGKIQNASKKNVQDAVKVLDEYYNSGFWPKSKWVVRASTLVKAADIMLARRNELSALISYEAGKAINESQADVDEAIDFLNFYARDEGRNEIHNPGRLSRGVIAVVSPWNFPLAIPCGMVCSALVAGNTVALKSAEQTPLIAQVLVDILHEAGVPKEALIHLPGEGETVGDELVSHERVAGVIFTGSKAVGELIASKVGKRIIHNKLFDVSYPAKVVTEMGGKNAIIVTANAELDETVDGILYSSFGHAGQKCSAASRVIVSNTIKNKLTERLREACADLKVGEAFEASTYVNPVISQFDRDRLRTQVKEACEEAKLYNGKVHIDRSAEELPGYCVGPVVIELPKDRAKNETSFAKRELFGPVIHVVGFDDLDEALEIFNGTEYALTGGVFSQSQDDIDYLTDRMKSGNLYVNRTITGARVGIEPFGGFKMSGTGPKAGSRSYLAALHLNPINLPLMVDLSRKTPDDETGESYDFTLARPSGLSVEKRLKKVLDGVDFLINNFESLFQGIYGENKRSILQFRKWLSKGSNKFLSKPINNRVIPGQLSFNMLDMKKSTVLIVAYEERAFFSTFMHFIGALVVGSGVTVLCRNQKSYTWWNTVLATMRRVGISKENFDVYFSIQEILLKNLAKPELEAVVVDGDISKVEMIASKCFELRDNNQCIKKLIVPYDAPHIDHFKRFLEDFVQPRSFAVNTMRHGAPLDVSL